MHLRKAIGRDAAVERPPSQSRDASAELVRIGALDDMSGPCTDNTGPGGVIAVRTPVEDFGGRVLGRPVWMVLGDHQNRPDIGSGIARRWFDLEDVRMVTGPGHSSVVLAVPQLAREKGPSPTLRRRS